MLCSRHSTGHAAEYLVGFDLSLRGMNVAINAFEHCAYDVIAERSGRLYRIQVKGTLKPGKKGAYRYVIGTTRQAVDYAEKMVDLIALVAIDLKTIIYRRPSDLGSYEKAVSVAEMAAGCDKALMELIGNG